jgi:hypothetical protein
MAMVVRANRQHAGIGGHISTFASSATLYEVGFNHFFRAKSAGHPGDMVFFQGHAVAGYLRPGLSGGSDYRVADGKFSAGIGRGRWPEFISPSVSHARLLAVSHRLHGPVANHGHLPGPLQPLYGRPGHQTAGRPAGMGVSGRRRDRRAGNTGGHYPGGPGAAGQPGFCDQLQSSAPGRARAWQWQNHPGAGGGLSRGRLERHQGDLGR